MIQIPLRRHMERFLCEALDCEKNLPKIAQLLTKTSENKITMNNFEQKQ